MKLINKHFLGAVSLLALSSQGAAAATPAEDLFPVAGEDGMAIDFVAPTPDMAINWASTPASEYNGDPFGKLTFARASTAYYYNSSGVLTQAASGSPRYDYNPSTLAARGLLIEEQRTNRCLRSAEFDNASWVKSNVTVTANDAVGPLGTTTADLLTATAANGTVIQDLGVVGSAAKTGSIFIKRKTGTGNIDLTLDGGTTWTTKVVTTTWTRFDLTQTLADDDFGIRIVTSGDEIWVEGGQVETGSFATSYIPTTTASVTRAADTVSIATSLIPYSTTAGSVFHQSMWEGIPSFHYIFEWRDGGTERIIQYNNGATPKFQVIDDNVVQANFGTGTVSIFTAYKVGVAWAANDFAKVLNGGTVDTDTVGTLPDVSAGILYLGSNAGATHINGWIRTFVYVPRRVADGDLQTLTT